MIAAEKTWRVVAERRGALESADYPSGGPSSRADYGMTVAALRRRLRVSRIEVRHRMDSWRQCYLTADWARSRTVALTTGVTRCQFLSSPARAKSADPFQTRDRVAFVSNFFAIVCGIGNTGAIPDTRSGEAISCQVRRHPAVSR